MVKSEVYFNIVDHKVAHEIIDGEVIVIQFDTGNYYSLEGVASLLWHWFTLRASRQQILDAFHNLQPDEIRSIDDFTDWLMNEELLVENAASDDHQPVSPLPDHEVPFELFKYRKFNDMQNLLLADPIHDVDEMGWPTMKADNV